LEWRNSLDNPLDLFRRESGQLEWGAVATNLVRRVFTQRPPEIEIGRRYEYVLRPSRYNPSGSLFDRYVEIGVSLKPTVDRGHALILVDEELSDCMVVELNRFRADLRDDGWSVEQFDAPRHDDKTWTKNPPLIERTKEIVRSVWRTRTNLSSIVIVGHVAIPHVGAMNAGGHGWRKWPVDWYYGDLVDDRLWTDDKKGIYPQHPYVPGDGLFDQLKFPSSIEAAVGRIDVSNLPVARAGIDGGRSSRDLELALLRRYFDKNHRYRTGALEFPARAACSAFFDGAYADRLTRFHAGKTATALYGADPSRVLEQQFFRKPGRFQWGFMMGAGRYDQIGVGNAANHIYARDIVSLDPVPEIAFYVLDGSYFGEWTSKNNLLRTMLTLPDSGLIATWGRFSKLRLGGMSLGDSFGNVMRRAINGMDSRDGSVWYTANVYACLLGDPTLRIR
jgi:hypothetical protein